MKYVGYHRTSTKEQNPNRGIRAIEDFAKQKGIKKQQERISTDHNIR